MFSFYMPYGFPLKCLNPFYVILFESEKFRDMNYRCIKLTASVPKGHMIVQ